MVQALEYRALEHPGLALDIHRPDDDRQLPCVAYFHGGGWARGSRGDNLEPRLRALAALGLAVASVSYRLTDLASHPAQLEDARAALRWLRANGAQHGLRSDRIGAWGASAGGWIALMLALTGEDPAGRADAAAAWFAVSDLSSVAAQRDAAGLPLPPFLQGRAVPDMEAALLGVASVAEAPQAAAEASPITHAATANGPILLIHGDRDGLVNCAQSVALHEALVRCGHDSQLLLVAGANHEDPAFHGPAVLGATAGFLQAQLSPGV